MCYNICDDNDLERCVNCRREFDRVQTTFTTKCPHCGKNYKLTPAEECREEQENKKKEQEAVEFFDRLEEKVEFLTSLIKTHPKQKTLIREIINDVKLF